MFEVVWHLRGFDRQGKTANKSTETKHQLAKPSEARRWKKTLDRMEIALDGKFYDIDDSRFVSGRLFTYMSLFSAELLRLSGIAEGELTSTASDGCCSPTK